MSYVHLQRITFDWILVFLYNTVYDLKITDTFISLQAYSFLCIFTKTVMDNAKDSFQYDTPICKWPIKQFSSCRLCWSQKGFLGKSYQSMVQETMRIPNTISVCEIKNTFIIILSCYLPFSLSFSHNCIVELSSL